MWDSSRAHFSPGTDRSSWMFKSVLSQQVNGFHFFYARWVLFLRFFSSLVPCFFFFFFCPFISVQWACLEITHYAQPNKLTDSGMGHSVIRWRQYHLVWRWATTASLISCFLPSINTTPLLRKCLRHAGTWLPLPPSLPPFLPPTVYVSHPLLLKHAYRYCFQVLQRDIYRVLQHICRIEMPNAALFLFCFDVPLKKKITSHFIFFLRVGAPGGGQVLKKPSVHWKFDLFPCFVIVFRSPHNNKKLYAYQ